MIMTWITQINNMMASPEEGKNLETVQADDKLESQLVD